MARPKDEVPSVQRHVRIPGDLFVEVEKRIKERKFKDFGDYVKFLIRIDIQRGNDATAGQIE